MEPGKGRYFGYTGVANVLDYTAVAVPVGRVDEEIDVKGGDGYVPTGETDREIWESCEWGSSSFAFVFGCGGEGGLDVLLLFITKERVISLLTHRVRHAR